MRPQSEEEALLHQNIWISDVWVCPSVSSHWLQPLARALAFWNNFQMNTTMPFPRLTTLFSLLGYVAINSHSQVLSLAIYSELISRLISLREIFYFQILGRRLTETNTTPVTQWLFSFSWFSLSIPGSIRTSVVAFIINVHLLWIGFAGRCTFSITQPLLFCTEAAF